MPHANTSWQRVAVDIADRIRSGETPVDSRIPSYRQLIERHDTSLGTVKRAVEYLQDAGILRGVQGAGVFVIRAPDGALDFDASAPSEVTNRIGHLEEAVDDLRAHLIELYARLGQPYPHRVGADDDGQQPDRPAAAVE